MRPTSGINTELRNPSPRPVAPTRGGFGLPGDVWQCLETFLVFTLEDSPCLLTDRGQGCGRRLQNDNRRLAGPKCLSAELEKTWTSPGQLRVPLCEPGRGQGDHNTVRLPPSRSLQAPQNCHCPETHEQRVPPGGRCAPPAAEGADECAVVSGLLPLP